MAGESEISILPQTRGISLESNTGRNYGKEMPAKNVPPEVVYAFAKYCGHLLAIPEDEGKDFAALTVQSCYFSQGGRKWPPTEDDLSYAVNFMNGRGVRKKAKIYRVSRGFLKDKPQESGFTLVCKPDVVVEGGLVDSLVKEGYSPTDLHQHTYFLSSQRIGGAKREMKSLGLGLEGQISQR